MKRVLFLLMITLMAGTVVAQPKARRQQQQKAQIATIMQAFIIL